MSDSDRDSNSERKTAAPRQPGYLANIVAAVRERAHPTQIGPYFILELIGEGGMGSVYKAEQREPIRRTVAIKVIKLGMDTRQVIARFESERQALALMDHPNVARVLDAGATESGRPYFVMEYVDGEPITAFCDRQKYTVQQRLELFTQACEAVQHAHQKAIIHRDLKPSNILVSLQDGKPWVKVIDFGVAKAISQKLTEKSLFTETGQLMGTPEYMAPEQAEGNALDVDTRTDVYSLGVVLYELLIGALPFDTSTLRSAGYNEIQRIIREVDPPRPSTRLSGLGKAAQEIAQSRQTRLDLLHQELKSELEWIPLKAMRKEPAQRYSSPRELSEDIGNYLAHRPLRAGPESRTYRTRKFLRRNKLGVAASAAMVFLLLAGVTATTWQAVRATRAEKVARTALRNAEDAAENVREVNRFLTDDLLASAAPEVTRGREMTVKEAVNRAAESVSQRFKNRPLTEAAIQSSLADTYDALGQRESALAHAQVARELLARERGPNNEATLAATENVGRNLARLNRHKEAEPMLRDVLERSRRLLGDEHDITLDCLAALATCIRMQNRFAEAEPLNRQLLDITRRKHGSQSERTAKALNDLAVLFNSQNRAEEAEPLYREAIAIREKSLGTDHPAYISTLSNFARVLENEHKLAEAEAMMRLVLREKRRILKDDHPSAMLTMNDLAVMLAMQEKYDEAEALHREALERRTRVLGQNDVDTLQSMQNLGRLLQLRGNLTEAEPLLVKALAGRRKVLGENHPNTVNSISGLANLYLDTDRFAQAEPMFAELTQPARLAVIPPGAHAVMFAKLGFCRNRLGRFADAEAPLLRARGLLIASKDEQTDWMRGVLTALSDVCTHTNRPDEAANWRAELAKWHASTRPASLPTTR